MMIDVDIVMNCNKKWNRKEGIEMNSIDDCCWLWLDCNCVVYVCMYVYVYMIGL